MTGTIYYVDLAAGKVWTEEIPDETYRRYPGGSALGLWLLHRHCPRGVDPYAPENPLIFTVSPLAGLPISGQSRMTAVARSPITGGAGDSQCGGYFPAEMKTAGADAFVFLGRSPEPVYLYLKDGAAELRPAGHLWGRVTGEVEAALQSELGDSRIQVAQVGPAGERQVRFAAIMNMANRANGRTGLGGVMGSKQLKAVVVRGTKPRKAADPRAFQTLARTFKAADQQTGVVEWGKLGTSGIVESQNYKGGLPTYNYNSGHFGAAAGRISGEAMRDRYLQEQDTCFACGIRCKRVVEIPGSVDPIYGGPEYETIATFGSYCGVDDLAAVCRANAICNMYGMDTIACGATIAWALEAGQAGLIPAELAGGLDLRFGAAATVLKLAEQIARREGLGDLLAEGSARAARQLGPAAEALTVTVKGAELPAHMPQVKRSMGLIYAVNPFGADHQSSEHDSALRSKPGTLTRDRLQALGIGEILDLKDLGEEKVRFTYRTQLLYSALDTYGLCQFVWGPAWQLYGPSETVELVRAATGWDATLDELLAVGERRLNLMRAFNAREGLDRRDDRLPAKLFRPLAGGPSDGLTLDPAQIEQAKEMYYRLAGWDPATGNPTPAKLKELGLDWVAP